MQNKGLIQFFAILFAAVSIYSISFTFVASGVKEDAKNFAKGDMQKQIRYLDSIGKEKVFLNYFTYNEVKEKQINKGLDLEGGINVILQISVKDILRGLSDNSTNPIFNKALADATANQKGNQTYLDAFFIAFENAAEGKAKLSDPGIFSNKILRDEVNFNNTNEETKVIITQKVDESIMSAFEVLRKRIDKFGVTQPNIQRLGNSGKILVELPGATEVDRIKKLLQGTAQLEFWETYKIDEVGQYLVQVNETLKATEIKKETDDATTKIDSLLGSATDSTDVAKGNNPLFDKIVSNGGGAVLGLFELKDTAQVAGYFRRDNIKNMLPANLRHAKFVFGKPMFIENEEKVQIEVVEFYALKGNKDNRAPISGGVITDARDTYDQLGKPAVTMQMNGAGAREWEKLTQKAFVEKSNIAIVLDNVVYSAPSVTSGAIKGGRSEITGSFTIEEAKDLANVLRAGKLPAKADIVQSDVVGPSLGQEAIDSGFLSFIFGMLLVVLWMIMYYGKSGVYANVSLLVNILFIFGILASLGAVLTLPGIAGIVLTIGMAVDANVIIFERAKEELDAGQTVEEAVNHAFTWKGAMSSIFDANITTALTALILLVFGTGPIKGFATTLLVGIITSLFTSIFITRMLLDWSLRRGDQLTFTTGLSKNWFKKVNIDFLAKRKIAYAVSSVLVIASLVSLFFVNGLNQGVDFVGGRTFQIRFSEKVVASEVAESLSKVFETNVEAKTFGTDDQLKITTKYKVEADNEGVDKEVNELLFKGLAPYLPKDLTYDKFVDNYDGKDIGILQATKVGPTIAEDIKANAYYAVLGSLLVVFLYLLVSFRKWQYSLGAVVAVFHDVIIVLGIYSFGYAFLPFNMEIDQAFIAAILTVIGYSLNDTVIVFDRVREFMADKKEGTFNQIVNAALNTTIGRTFNTSFTTLIVLIAIFIMGGETIRGFVFAILVGITVGTYSSLYIATPIMFDTINSKDANKKDVDASGDVKE
ncbi:MAG: protein translocase subunit SecDF [Flavobacterium sp.]